MKPTQRVLAIIAVLILVTQTVRHTYVLWVAPRTSVLDRFDRPLSDRISAARSLDELVRLYEPVRAEADRARKASGEARDTLRMRDEPEPFRSETELREAIETWESKAKEVHAVLFYWCAGLLVLLIGLSLFRFKRVWFGLALEITAFAEFVYWTSPSLLGGNVREFDRLLTLKVGLSVLSLLLLILVIYLQRVFADAGHSEELSGRGPR